MKAKSFQACRIVKTKHQIHVLYGGMRPTLTDAVEYAEDNDSAALLVDVQADVTKIRPRYGGNPWVGQILTGSALFLRQTDDLNEELIFVKILIQLEQCGSADFFDRKAMAYIEYASGDGDVRRREVNRDGAAR